MILDDLKDAVGDLPLDQDTADMIIESDPELADTLASGIDGELADFSKMLKGESETFDDGEDATDDMGFGDI